MDLQKYPPRSDFSVKQQLNISIVIYSALTKKGLKFPSLFFVTCLAIILSGCIGKRHYSTLPPVHSHEQKATNNNSNNKKGHAPITVESKPIYVCEDISRFVDKQVGNGECVDLLKACASTPNTDQWREGESVWGNSIPTGTAIATFKQSKYPNRHGYHAAIYVSQDDKGIYVWDQWRGKNVHLRLIRFDDFKKKPGNDAARYSVITQ